MNPDIQTNLENALALLEHDVAQHVAALAAARQSALDTTFIEAATQRVVAVTQALAASYATSVAPGVPSAPEAPVGAPALPYIPDFFTPVAPAAPTVPSVAESIAAAVADAPK